MSGVGKLYISYVSCLIPKEGEEQKLILVKLDD